jgi:hypothetical protein
MQMAIGEVFEFSTQGTARMLNARSRTSSLEFVNTELDLGRRFAEKALALFSDGDLCNAQLNALVAKQAYQIARNFSAGLGVSGEQRKEIDAKLANLGPLLEKLSEI